MDGIMDSCESADHRSDPIAGAIELRDVVDSDLDYFFTHQLDEEASDLVGFSPRTRPEFDVHWAKVLADDDITKQTIVAGGHVAGNVVCFLQGGEREVGYWLGHEFWGRGIATEALRLFLAHVSERPLYAHVAKHNRASVRVLEKCGFVAVGTDRTVSEVTNEVIEEFLMKLN